MSALLDSLNALPPLLTGVRAAIIDLDGTMIDTAPDFHVAVNAMRADLSLPPLPMEQIVAFVGKGSENLVRSALAVDFDEGKVEFHFAGALAAYLCHYAAINGRYSRVYPDVVEGLQALKAKQVRLACVTNKPIAFARQLLEQMGLLAFFDVIYGGDSLPTKKPDPAPLLQVCADFDLSPTQVIAIGDSANDAMAAQGAGCRVLLLPYGYNHGESVHDVNCDGIVATLLAAAQLVAN